MTPYGFREHKDYLSIRLPNSIIDKIDDVGHRHRLSNRSEAARQLLEMALYIESKMGEIEAWTPQDMKDLQDQFETGQLVDWVAKIDDGRFKAILNIFKEEEAVRYKRRP